MAAQRSRMHRMYEQSFWEESCTVWKVRCNGYCLHSGLDAASRSQTTKVEHEEDLGLLGSDGEAIIVNVDISIKKYYHSTLKRHKSGLVEQKGSGRAGCPQFESISSSSPVPKEATDMQTHVTIYLRWKHSLLTAPRPQM